MSENSKSNELKPDYKKELHEILLEKASATKRESDDDVLMSKESTYMVENNIMK